MAEFDVFISYKREERALAEQVAAALEEAGYTQVTDLSLQNGDHFGDAIDRMIRGARLVLVLWTPAAASSDWVKDEARLGVELGTYLGVMVEPTVLPVDLKFKQHLDLAGAKLPESMPHLVGAITAAIGPPKTSPQIAATKSTGLNDDLRLFETAERSDTVAAYAAYLEAFPQGVMAKVARKRERDRKTLAYRVRRMLPNAAIIGALAGLGALILQAFFSDEADAYFERQAKLRAAEADIARLSRELETAPTPGALAAIRSESNGLRSDLRSAEEAIKDLRAALSEQSETIGDMTEELDAAPSPDAFAALQRENEALRGDLAENETRATDPGGLLTRPAALLPLPDSRSADDPEAAISSGTSGPVPAPDCETDGKQGYDLPKAGCVPLDATELDLRHSAATDADVKKIAGLGDLKVLSLSSTDISDIEPLSQLGKLETLWLFSTEVSDIKPLAGFARLESLGLGSTEVSNIDALAGLTSLQFLSLADTEVSTIEALAGLDALQILYLERTQVDDIEPLAGHTGLQRLTLDETEVNDFSPLENLTALHWLVTPDGTPLGLLFDALEARAEVRAWIEANT